MPLNNHIDTKVNLPSINDSKNEPFKNKGWSSVRKIKTGIFQGSVLGPTLYIIYTNCITVHEDKITSLSQYADDGSIRQRLSRRHAVNQVNIQNKVTQIQKYMDANKLKLNIEKTQMMVVKKGSNNLHSGLHLKLGDTIIKQESSLKILGLTIDSDLKFVDYSQIFKDFETDNEAKLIEKVMVIAARTKDVSAA